MRLFVPAVLLVSLPAAGAAQTPEPGPRNWTLQAGVGNSFGWFGLNVEKHLTGERFSVFGGLGYSPEPDDNDEPSDASGVAVAAGVRGFTPGRKHRGFLELSISQVAVETNCTGCARLYGPGIQAGWHYTATGGFTLLLSAGLGFALGADEPQANVVQPMFGFGLGYTWR